MTTIVRDPGITIGAYRVLERTDGLFILFDDRLPKDGSVAWIGPSKADAIREAERLTTLGSPIVIANPAATQNQRLAAVLAAHKEPASGDGGDSKRRRSR